MTIASQTSRVSYTGDGVNTAFSVPFYFQFNIDLVVYITTAAGIAALQIMGTNYSLAGATLSAGGTCTFTIAPPAGATVAIYRDPLLTQTTSYNNNDPFPAKSHELALDKAVTIDQRTRDIALRSFHIPDGDPAIATAAPSAALRANKALGFDAAGNVTVLNPVGSPGPVGSAQFFDTRAQALSTAIPAVLTFIVINKYAVGYPIAPAQYVPGTSTGPMAFLDAGGLWWQLNLSGGPTNVLWFGAAGDDRTNDQVPINAAVTALAAQGGGRVYIPKPPFRYRINAPIQAAVNVSFFGDGGLNSLIYCDNTNGIEINFLTPFGKVSITDLYFLGVNIGDNLRYGITQPGTLDFRDDLYGVTIARCQFQNLYAPIHFRTVRNLTIFDCFGININAAIELIGLCGVVTIMGNRFTYGVGCGHSGNIVGLNLDFFNYTGFGGVVKPEGIEVVFNQFFGFAYACRINLASSVNIVRNSFDGASFGIWISACTGYLNIQGNDIEMQSASATAGIWLGSQSSDTASKICIRDNHLISTANVVGLNAISIGDLQYNHTITGNTFDGTPAGFYDIFCQNAGKLNIEDNLFNSPLAAGSMFIGARVAGVITINNNTCKKPITINPPDLAAGYVIKSNNVVAGVLDPSWTVPVTGVVSPVGVVTSAFLGQEYLDQSIGKWWKANAAASSANWVALN